MTTSDNTSDGKLASLLELVETNRRERCAQMIADAEALARQIVGKAFADARAQVHYDILKLREDMRHKIRSAEAQRQTRIRQRRQRADRRVLKRACGQLPGALQARWQRSHSRKLWITALIRQASISLIDRHWRIEYPLNWPAEERRELSDRLHRDLGQSPHFAPEATVTAGLRIHAGGACVDGTIEGLLQNSDYIEALLLAAINQNREDVRI
jgi:hypothetical protein